jgi:hypothetical protein
MLPLRSLRRWVPCLFFGSIKGTSGKLVEHRGVRDTGVGMGYTELTHQVGSLIVPEPAIKTSPQAKDYYLAFYRSILTEWHPSLRMRDGEEMDKERLSGEDRVHAETDPRQYRFEHLVHVCRVEESLRRLGDIEEDRGAVEAVSSEFAGVREQLEVESII